MTSHEPISASGRLFSNYELLEHTLLFLPLRDLLLAQRINKACFDVVKRSKSIRRALWLEPSADVVQPWGDENHLDGLWYDPSCDEMIEPVLNPFCTT